jgi:multidrug efflux pump subunit AcrA (membrane-fusion protein)
MAAVACFGIFAVAIAVSDDFENDVRDRLGLDDSDEVTATAELVAEELEVVTDKDGRIVTVLASNGDRVEPGDVLAVLAEGDEYDLAEQATKLYDEGWVFAVEYATGVRRPGDSIADLEAAAIEAADALREADIESEEMTALAAARDRIATARLALAEDRLTNRDAAAVARALQEVQLLRLEDIRPDLSSVTAPIVGTVVAVLVEPEDMVEDGQSVFRLRQDERLELLVRVTEDDADRIDVGQEVEVESDDLDDTFDGEVVDVYELDPDDISEDDEDEDLTYGVLIAVDNEDGELESGDSVEVRIELD